MTGRVALIMTVLCVASAGAQTRGTNGSDLLALGVNAYRDVQLSIAGRWLRQALAENLSTADRIRALTYLGATEVARGAERRDSAALAFQRLLLLDPRQRPDGLVFPPAVLSAFDAVRRATKAVLVVPRPATADGSFVADVYSTSHHELEVTLARENGAPVRTLYAGPVGDSMVVRWDGRDTAGSYMTSGPYLLSFASRATVRGPIARLVQLPLDVQLTGPELLAEPPPLADSLLLPERTRGRSGLRSLTMGLVAGGVAFGLPSLVADGSKPSPARFAVAGAVSIAGVVGLFTAHPRPIPANITVNRSRRVAWQQQVDAVRTENEQRRHAARAVIRAGTPTIIEQEGGQP